MSNDTTASAVRALPDEWDELAAKFEAQGDDISRAEGASMRNDAKELRAAIAKDDRAALARAPLPALTDDEVYTLRCAAENMRSADAENSATIVDARFRLASKLEKIANRLSAAPAQADEARDAARLEQHIRIAQESGWEPGDGEGWNNAVEVVGSSLAADELMKIGRKWMRGKHEHRGTNDFLFTRTRFLKMASEAIDAAMQSRANTTGGA